MNLSEFESQFKEFVSKAEKEADANFSDYNAKSKTWERVQKQIGTPVRRLPTWTIAAASVIFVIFGSYTFSEINKRDKLISQLQYELNNAKSTEKQLSVYVEDLKGQLVFEQNKPPKVDTVYRTKMVYLEPEIVEEPVLISGTSNSPLLPEPIDANQDLFSRYANPVGDNLINLASVPGDIKSLKIEYGEITKDGLTPCKFTIKYN